LITYKPLRDYLKLKKISYYKLEKEVKISQSVTKKISKDEFIHLESLAKICDYLEIPIERAVQLKKFTSFSDDEYLKVINELRNNIKILKSQLWKYQNSYKESRKKRGSSYYIRNFKQYRINKNMTMQNIATYFGLTVQMISLWESKKAGVSEKYINGLKELLGIDLEDIVEWKEAKKRGLIKN
jgi:Helix-turn-helix.